LVVTDETDESAGEEMVAPGAAEAAPEASADAAQDEVASVATEISDSASDESPSEDDATPVAPVSLDPNREVKPLEEVELDRPEPTGVREWYILKVQSNREDSIRDALLRRIQIAGLEGFFGDIIVPAEMVTEIKGGKKKVVKRKLYPGYIVVHMEYNDDTWYLVRDTPGVGDFTGAGGKPTPMLPHEVSKILVMESAESKEKGPKPKISFAVGDRVKINEGTFENFEGEVGTIDEGSGRVTVMINIFGRSTPVELEYWQIESI
jgi:transcriptional antiterminator NusG